MVKIAIVYVRLLYILGHYSTPVAACHQIDEVEEYSNVATNM